MTHPQGPAGPGPGGTTGPGRVTTFEFGDLPLRTVTVGGEPWFVAADVARLLGYRMASDMTRRLDEDDRGTRSVRTPSASHASRGAGVADTAPRRPHRRGAQQ